MTTPSGILPPTFKKMHLTLHPGPRLLCHDWQHDPSRSAGGYVDHDVTEQAACHLFDTVALTSGVALRDIFLLLDANPLLLQVFAKDWAAELLAEIMGSAKHSAVPSIEYDPQGIEFLELYQVWHRDSENGELQLQPIHRLGFHGVGFRLREDGVHDGQVEYRADERIHWGVSLVSPLELLHLPMRLNPEVVIREHNLDSVDHGQEIGRLLNPGVTLGQVLNGILRELSWHGASASKDRDRAELERLLDAIETGTAVTGQSGDLFADRKATLLACLDDTAGHAPEALYAALLKIGDRENAEVGLRARLGNVHLKARFADISGMELRAHVRRNSRLDF